MVVIHVSIQPLEDRIERFEEVLHRVVEEARRVPGCLRYQWYGVPDLQDHYVAYGEFSSKEYFEGYLQSAVVKRIGTDLIPLLAGPPKFVHYEATVLGSG